MGPSPEDIDRGPRSRLTEIGRSLRSHLADIARDLPSHLARIGHGLRSGLTGISHGLRAGHAAVDHGLRSYIDGLDPDLRPYLAGFALALILTGIPFALVAINPLPKLTTLIIIAAAAAIQVLVHLRYFLHLDLTSTPRENLVAIMFTAILIFLMVGGSFWIMFDLHNRMAM